MAFYALDPLYYTPAKIAAINEAIATIMPVFVAKEMNIENKHLRQYIVNLIREHSLTSIALVIQYPQQAHAIDE